MVRASRVLEPTQCRLVCNFLNSRTQGGASPLVYAAVAGKTDAVEYLLSKGANANHKNSVRERTKRHISVGVHGIDLTFITGLLQLVYPTRSLGS